MATDSKAMDIVATATMTTLLVITAMGVATITVSDKCPRGKKKNGRSLIFLVLLVVQKNSVPFSLVLQTRAIQAMGKLQDVATRIASSHTDHT